MISGNSVKLSDLGSAAKVDKKRNSLIGTYGYMSPEILMKENYGRFADIWSFGCLIYELVSGELPFFSKNVFCFVEKVLEFNDDFEFLEVLDVHEFLKDFLKCCLRKNPRERNNSFELLNHPFICEDFFLLDNFVFLNILNDVKFESKKTNNYINKKSSNFRIQHYKSNQIVSKKRIKNFKSSYSNDNFNIDFPTIETKNILENGSQKENGYPTISANYC